MASIKTTDMFLRKEGQQLDFSAGKLDLVDLFNNTAQSMNQLSSSVGLEDSVEDDKSNIREEEDSKIFNFLSSQIQPESPQFGFENQPQPNRSNESNTQTINDPKGARFIEDHGSKDLTSFVKTFEGFNPNAYADGRQRSIGFGTRAKEGERSISEQEAERRLGSELSMHRGRVVSLAKKAGYDFTPSQVDALTSFDYNTGSLEKLTNNGKRTKSEIADKILLYNKADLDGKGLKPLRGLTRRREAESKLFTKGY